MNINHNEQERSMTKAMTLRLPAAMHEALRRRAFDERTSINALIIAALADLPKPGTLCDKRTCWNQPTHVVAGGFHFCAEHLPAVYGDIIRSSPETGNPPDECDACWVRGDMPHTGHVSGEQELE